MKLKFGATLQPTFKVFHEMRIRHVQTGRRADTPGSAATVTRGAGSLGGPFGVGEVDLDWYNRQHRCCGGPLRTEEHAPAGDIIRYRRLAIFAGAGHENVRTTAPLRPMSRHRKVDLERDRLARVGCHRGFRGCTESRHFLEHTPVGRSKQVLQVELAL